MLIEIAWKNPFIMPVGKEKGKWGGWRWCARSRFR